MKSVNLYKISGDTLLVKYDGRDDWRKVLDDTLKALGRDRDGFHTIQLVIPDLWDMAVKMVTE